MPISALPQETARILTSSVALNDAVSLVKELVDNALDAHATNITIEISTNTVDVVQVKDNGSGIGVDDRQLLCQRGCTSKIRTMDDLASLGGTSLGFRGEALYSACNVSASILVTTRVEGEMVGSAIKFGPNGKMLSSSSASHPVGTTVRVQDFLTNIPVRKQAALKAASKTLSNVRKLLSAYAFARPEVRMSFKVLKAKNDKTNWNYAPNAAGTTLMEAATKIVGVEVANQLLLRHSDAKPADHCDAENGQYKLEALLIKPDSDAQKACSSEQFIAVDDRPVNTEKDLMKDLLKTYKKFLRNSLSPQSNTTYTKPFLCLHISCPPESYDINVEPAKDRVMFYKPSIVSDTFENMLTTLYGALTESAVPLSGTVRVSELPQANSFDLLLAQKAKNPSRTEATPNLQSLDEHIDAADENAAGDLAVRRLPVEQERSSGEISHDSDNPWTKAKMNVRLYPQESYQSKSSLSGSNAAIPANDQQCLPEMPPPSTPQAQLASHPARVLTPQVSSDSELPFQNPGPPIPRRGPRGETSEASPPPTASREPTLLEGWIQAQSQPASHSPSMEPSRSPTTEIALFEPGDTSAFPSRINKPTNRLLNTGSRDSSKQQTLAAPFKRPRLSQFPLAPNKSPESHSHPRPQHAGPSRIEPASRQESEQELGEIMQFERQKKEISQQRRKAIRAARAAGVTYTAELSSNLPEDAESEASMSSTQARSREDFGRQFAGQDGDDHDTTQGYHGRIVPPLLGAQRRRTVASRDHSEASGAAGPAEEPHRLPEAEDVTQMDVPRIPDADPRAYLVRQRKAQADDAYTNAAGMTRTGLKIRRVKSTRLPLETVPAGHELFHLATVFESGVASTCENAAAANFDLCSATKDLNSTDEYVKHGSIDRIKWLSTSQDISSWENDLLLKLQVKAGCGSEDVALNNLSLHIAKAIKAHIDEYGE